MGNAFRNGDSVQGFAGTEKHKRVNEHTHLGMSLSIVLVDPPDSRGHPCGHYHVPTTAKPRLW